jgi:hypothetical protein
MSIHIEQCECGIYALSSLELLLNSDFGLNHPELLFGTIQGWGEIVIHEKGFRSSYAKVIALLNPQTLPFAYSDDFEFMTETTSKEALDISKRYGIPVLSLNSIETYSQEFAHERNHFLPLFQDSDFLFNN